MSLRQDMLTMNKKRLDTEKNAALYGRLSRNDEMSAGDSNSIIHQENICQGDFIQKMKSPNKMENEIITAVRIKASSASPLCDSIRSAFVLNIKFLRNIISSAGENLCTYYASSW